MTKKDKEEIERLVNLQAADMADKESTLVLVKKYVNKSALFCLTCDGAVKVMFNQLRAWWNKQNKTNWKFIKTIN